MNIASSLRALLPACALLLSACTPMEFSFLEAWAGELNEEGEPWDNGSPPDLDIVLLGPGADCESGEFVDAYEASWDHRCEIQPRRDIDVILYDHDGEDSFGIFVDWVADWGLRAGELRDAVDQGPVVLEDGEAGVRFEVRSL